MAPPLHYPPEQPAAPVQFVDPGQLFYNPPPPPAPPVYNFTSPTLPKRAPTPHSQPSDKPKIRPLNVDEALQFSPLASIIPFDASMIPMVNAHVSVSQSAFSSKEQQAEGEQRLKSLNEQATQRNGQNMENDAVLNGLLGMLKEKQSTPYSFKLPIGSAAPKARATGARAHLSPFARAALDKANVKHKHGPSESKLRITTSTSRKTSDTPKASSLVPSPKSRPSLTPQPPQTPIQPQLTQVSLQPRSPEPANSSGVPFSSPSVQLQGQLQRKPSSSSSASNHPQKISREDRPIIPPSPEQSDEKPVRVDQASNQGQSRAATEAHVKTNSHTRPQPQHPRPVPAIHIPPVPAELKATTPAAQRTHLLPAVELTPDLQKQPHAPTSEASSKQHSSQSPFEIRIPPVSAEYRQAVKPPLARAEPHRTDLVSSQASRLSVVIPLDPLFGSQDSHKSYPTVPANLVKTHYQDQSGTAADATLHDLQNVLNDVFEAESEAQASGLNANTEGVLIAASGPDGEIIALGPSMLVKLDSSLRKVIERRRFSAITVEQVLQLQILCERSLSCAESMQLNLQSDWPTLEETARHEEVTVCEQVLKSARIILRTMTSGRADKQILAEERLQKCITILTKVVDNLILPTVEARSTGADTSVFQLASSYKKQISQLLFECNKLMQILIEILSKEEIAETAVNQVEYFVIRMLFVENGPTEKESVLGISKFEGFRKLAMLVLVEIYTRYPEQRQFIISEVLSSLQKLPTARQQGRQFKLENGKRLQLVTVLLVRLVQASGIDTSSKSTRAALRAEKAELEDEEGEDSEEEDELAGKNREQPDSEEEDEEMKDDIIPNKLIRTVRRLHDSAMKSAWQIVSFLVQRASTASKTGEQPHRHLLDMFVEDLINVLGSAEWPGAEMLLQLLVNKMRDFVTEAKTPAPVKTMALETLGTLGTAILDTTFDAQHVARTLENDGVKFSIKLVGQLESHSQGQLADFDVVNWKGPFRAVLDHLSKRSSDGQIASAQGFILTKWTKTLLWGNKSTGAELDEKRVHGGARELGLSLCRMTSESKWNDPDPPEIGDAQARLAYLVCILHVGFCQAFPHIVNMLLSAITSDQITVRARALKSVTQMLEKDPALLDRYPQVMNLIIRCANDSSASVRDSSLNLLGKCIALRPSVEKDVIHTILGAAADQTVGIRKRALRLLREAYLRNSSEELLSGKIQEWRRNIKSLAAISIFRRISDEESSVVELVQQIFEEIWLDPFRTACSQDASTISKSAELKEQMSFLIQTVCDHEDFATPVQELFKFALSSKGKNHESTLKVCKALVVIAFEGVIAPDELPGSPPQHRTLRTLAIFARTQPKIFTTAHIELLKPYISCLSNDDDLNLFRGVVVIFRCVLPTLPSLQHETLRKVQTDLLQSVSKLPKAELDEVASCLWTISRVLNSVNALVRLTMSVLTNLQKFAAVPDLGDDVLMKVQRLMRIAGHFGKYCDFQPELTLFNKTFPNLKGDLVAGKIVSGLQPFTSAKRSLGCKAAAWESIGMICQSWPKTFNHPGIANDIQQILQNDEQTLQRIILLSIRDFFATQDQAHDTESNALSKDPLAQGKLGGSMTATDNDGAASLIAQIYLKHILRISVTTTQDIALIATEVTASISRQGLVHPKEVGPALFALVTSPDEKVVAVALQQLRNLHSQHETLFEREYIRSINEAFVYQKDVAKSSSGSVGSPPRAKLHHVFEVIKESKVKFVTKFLTNFCGRTDFDLSKLDVSGKPPKHLEYARFLLENLPFFDFTRLDDITLVITCLEKAVAATGSIVAHAINTEIFNVTVESILGQQNVQANGSADYSNGNVEAVHPSIEVLQEIGRQVELAQPIVKAEVDPERLRRLTTAAMILTMIWEARTHLRKLYGINAANQAKIKSRLAKDTNRAPTKNGLVSGDKYLEKIATIAKSLDTNEASTERCRSFAALMAIDDELKVGKGDASDAEGDIDALDLDDELSFEASGRGIKRKNSTPAAQIPKKKRARHSKTESRRSSEDAEMWS